MKGQEDLMFLGMKVASLIGGAIGSLIGMSFSDEKYENRLEALVKSSIKFIGGIAAAVYVTPLIGYYRDLPKEFDNAVSFVIGIVGMNVASIFYNKSKNFKISKRWM
jgi:uncharacterized membrane protein YfcA